MDGEETEGGPAEPMQAELRRLSMENQMLAAAAQLYEQRAAEAAEAHAEAVASLRLRAQEDEAVTSLSAKSLELQGSMAANAAAAAERAEAEAARAEAAALRGQLAEVGDEVAAYRARADRCIAVVRKLQGRVDAMRQRAAQQGVEVGTPGGREDNWEAEIEALQTPRTSLRLAPVEGAPRIDSLQEQLASAEELCAAAVAERNESRRALAQLEAEREADRAMVAKVGQELSNLRVSAKQKDGILGLAQTEILTNRRKLQCSTAYTAFVQQMVGDRAVRAARAGLVAEAFGRWAATADTQRRERQHATTVDELHDRVAAGAEEALESSARSEDVARTASQAEQRADALRSELEQVVAASEAAQADWARERSALAAAHEQHIAELSKVWEERVDTEADRTDHDVKESVEEEVQALEQYVTEEEIRAEERMTIAQTQAQAMAVLRADMVSSRAAMEEAQRAKDEQAQLVSELRVELQSSRLELSEATSALRTDLAVAKTELTQAETSADAQSEAVTALRSELQSSRAQLAELLSAHRGRVDSAQRSVSAVASEPPVQMHAEGAEEERRQAPAATASALAAADQTRMVPQLQAELETSRGELTRLQKECVESSQRWSRERLELLSQRESAQAELDTTRAALARAELQAATAAEQWQRERQELTLSKSRAESGSDKATEVALIEAVRTQSEEVSSGLRDQLEKLRGDLSRTVAEKEAQGVAWSAERAELVNSHERRMLEEGVRMDELLTDVRAQSQARLSELAEHISKSTEHASQVSARLLETREDMTSSIADSETTAVDWGRRLESQMKAYEEQATEVTDALRQQLATERAEVVRVVAEKEAMHVEWSAERAELVASHERQLLEQASSTDLLLSQARQASEVKLAEALALGRQVSAPATPLRQIEQLRADLAETVAAKEALQVEWSREKQALTSAFDERLLEEQARADEMLRSARKQSDESLQAVRALSPRPESPVSSDRLQELQAEVHTQMQLRAEQTAELVRAESELQTERSRAEAAETARSDAAERAVVSQARVTELEQANSSMAEQVLVLQDMLLSAGQASDGAEKADEPEQSNESMAEQVRLLQEMLLVAGQTGAEDAEAEQEPTQSTSSADANMLQARVTQLEQSLAAEKEAAARLGAAHDGVLAAQRIEAEGQVSTAEASLRKAEAEHSAAMAEKEKEIATAAEEHAATEAQLTARLGAARAECERLREELAAALVAAERTSVDAGEVKAEALAQSTRSEALRAEADAAREEMEAAKAQAAELGATNFALTQRLAVMEHSMAAAAESRSGNHGANPAYDDSAVDVAEGVPPLSAAAAAHAPADGEAVAALRAEVATLEELLAKERAGASERERLAVSRYAAALPLQPHVSEDVRAGLPSLGFAAPGCCTEELPTVQCRFLLLRLSCVRQRRREGDGRGAGRTAQVAHAEQGSSARGAAA